MDYFDFKNPYPKLAKGQDCLIGQLLVAMPGLDQGCFKQSVVLVCTHDDDHAMGLVINKLMDDIDLEKVLVGLEIEGGDASLMHQPVHYGGPVAEKKGLVLHSTDQAFAETTLLWDGMGLTSTKDILLAMTQKITAPQGAKLCMGYAGWDAGQLEEELVQNVWLTLPASHELLFDTPAEMIWDAAYAHIGLRPDELPAFAAVPRDPTTRLH